MSKINNTNTIAKSASYVLIITLIAKVIGFIETAVVAAYFGTSVEVDMFYMANTISNKFVFTIFSGLAVVGLTMYNSARHNSEQGGSKFISGLIAYMLPLSLLAGVIIYISAPYVSNVMASNYGDYEKQILTKYLCELSIVSVFYTLTTIFTCVLNAHKKFLPGTVMGVMQNVSMIAFVLMLSDELGVNSVVIGFVVAYVLQSLFLYMFVRKICKFQRFSKADIDIKRIGILILPLLLGEATGEINTLVDQYLATMQGAGFVSALSYSETLNDVVTALFIQTITTVLLSYFSVLAVEGKILEMLNELKSILKNMTLVLIPISIVTVLCAAPLVSFVFERGAFDKTSVSNTSLALIGYGLGFVFKTIMVISKRPFFAIENTKTPMLIGVYSVVINITLSIFLSHWIGVLGITLATSLSYLFACILYVWKLSSTFKEMSWGDCLPFMKKVIVATLLSVLFVYVFTTFGIESPFINLLVCTLVCFSTYIIILKFFKLEELSLLENKILTTIHNKKSWD